MSKRKAGSLQKPRPDIKMNLLSAARRNAIFELSKTMSGRELVAVLKEKDGLKISETALFNWLKGERISRRVSNSYSVARHIVAALKEAQDSGDLDSAIEKMARQRTFDLLAEESSDVSEIVAMNKLILEQRKTALDERRIALLERKAEAFDKIKNAAEDKQISSAERMKRIDKILLG